MMDTLDIDRKLDSHFISEAERQWDNLTGEIPFYFCEFMSLYVAACWRNLSERARDN